MLTRLYPHELDATTINHYHNAIGTDDHAGDVDLVSQGIYRNHLQLWVWETDSSTMTIITEVKVHPDGYQELLVSMLAGKGGVSDWTEVVNAFSQSPCTDFKCERVIAYVKPELWKKFKKHGASAKELYVVIGKDRNDDDT
jgi:hypothetical protein